MCRYCKHIVNCNSSLSTDTLLRVCRYCKHIVSCNLSLSTDTLLRVCRYCNHIVSCNSSLSTDTLLRVCRYCKHIVSCNSSLSTDTLSNLHFLAVTRATGDVLSLFIYSLLFVLAVLFLSVFCSCQCFPCLRLLIPTPCPRNPTKLRTSVHKQN